jgi:hypothetical protein
MEPKQCQILHTWLSNPLRSFPYVMLERSSLPERARERERERERERKKERELKSGERDESTLTLQLADCDLVYPCAVGIQGYFKDSSGKVFLYDLVHDLCPQFFFI